MRKRTPVPPPARPPSPSSWKTIINSVEDSVIPCNPPRAAPGGGNPPPPVPPARPPRLGSTGAAPAEGLRGPGERRCGTEPAAHDPFKIREKSHRLFLSWLGSLFVVVVVINFSVLPPPRSPGAAATDKPIPSNRRAAAASHRLPAPAAAQEPPTELPGGPRGARGRPGEGDTGPARCW